MQFLIGLELPRTLRVGILAAAVILLIGFPALAQEEEQELTPEQQEAIAQAEQRSFEEEITVTGSLIPRPTLESLSPVSVMDPEQITYTGVLRLEDVVRQMPQVFSPQNSTIANGASGTATLDLRNLGSERTLVLVNGRRMVPGDAWEISPDINFIPSALVKRVDVLTGGASSVYGADAVTGVVNFVLDEDFEGMKGGISWNGYQHDNNNGQAQAMNEARGFAYPDGSDIDGDQYDINLAFGHKFGEGRGHASMYFDYRNIEELLKSGRDYLNCAPGQGDDGPFCSGSGTIPEGRFLVYDPDYNFLGDYILDQGTGDIRPRAGEVFNYAPYNHVQRPDEKYSAGAFMNYEFNDAFELYGEVMFMDDYTKAQIAPSGNFGNTSLINCDNPMMSEQQREIICPSEFYGPEDYSNTTILKRNIEGGPRVSIMRHTTWRLVAGLRGDLSDAWSYDVYGLYSQMVSPQEYIGDLSVTRMIDALDVVGDPDDPSTWECRSGNDGCAPWNLFTPGGVTPEAIDYISLNMVLTSGTRTEMINGVLNGDLGEYGLKFPTATEGIQLALGADYRTEMLYIHPDDNWESGNGSGQGGPTVRVDGNYDVAEYFFEGLVPIVQDAPGFKNLSLELGYRWSDYSTVGGADTWKAQGEWAISDLFKFRGGFASATRAPNVFELYRPQGIGLGGSDDPCAGTNPAATQEQCLLTGMTAAQWGHVLPNPADQYNTLEGGNPNLDPETADTITAGIVITPPSVSGLSFAVDYWDVQIDQVISSFDADSVLAGCIANGDPALCGLIHRDIAGTLWLFQDGYTESTEQNLGTLEGEGVDFNYAWLIGLGDSGFLNTSLVGTWMLTNELDNPLIGYDCVGFFGNQCAPYPTPDWRHLARISWETSFDMVFTLGWRYITSVMNDDTSSDPDLNSDNPGDEFLQVNGVYEFDDFNYFDLAWTWDFADHYQVVLGVNNILDEEPPLGAGMNDNDYGPGFYGFYDAYGRQLHAAIHFDF
jgi:outer membrane receptor protein involved in Fe transport